MTHISTNIDTLTPALHFYISYLYTTNKVIFYLLYYLLKVINKQNENKFLNEVIL